MNRQDTFLSTIEPYWIDPDAWWRDRPVEDISAMNHGHKDVLLIIGDGRNVLDDVTRFVSFGVPFDTMCINYSVKLIRDILPIAHYIAGDSHTPSMQKVAGSLKNGTIRHCWNVN